MPIEQTGKNMRSSPESQIPRMARSRFTHGSFQVTVLTAAINQWLNIRITIITVLLAVCAGYGLHAEILSEAMLVFPAQTQSLEYDNLAALRNLPNYRALQQQFSGTVLQQAKLAIAKFGMEEEQVDELVLGSTTAALYGLLSGTFNRSHAVKVALKKGISPLVVNGEEIFCPGAGICLLFLEDSVAAFGTSEQLKTMLDARQDIITRLSSNRNLIDLIYATDRRAPVRGAAFGSRLDAVIANAFQATAGRGFDWVQYSALISTFGYSLNLDGKAHVSAMLECKTSAAAVLLRQMLGALAGLESLGVKVSKNPAGTLFQNVQVSSSDRTIQLEVETLISK
jgi:hypothetical protein